MKPKIAFFDFACCEGCQLQVVNLEAEMVDLLNAVEIVQFREAIKYRPDFAPAHLNLGLMLAKLGKPDQALAEFRITLQLDPTNPSARQYLETNHVPTGHGPAGDLK